MRRAETGIAWWLIIWISALVPVSKAQDWSAGLSAIKWTQRGELTASDGLARDALGSAIAVSGNAVVIGAANATIGNNQAQGAAYVFVKPAGGWKDTTQVAKLTASDGQALDSFGTSVSISGDTIVVGSPLATVTWPQAGAAYVFVKPAQGWKDMTETAKLTASSPQAGAGLGVSVAVSGHTIVAGANGVTVGNNSGQGAAYVFVEPKSGWTNSTETAILTSSDGHWQDYFGYAVAISGKTLVVGAIQWPMGKSKGAVYLFEEPKQGWKNGSENARLTAADGADNQELGFSLALDENSVVAGAPRYYPNLGPGAVYIFTKPASGWKTTGHYTAELTDNGGFDVFGTSVAKSGDRIVGGASYAAIGSNQCEGATYVFNKPKDGWKTTQKFSAELTPSNGQYYQFFGSAVAARDNTIFVGAPDTTVGNNFIQGAGYAFTK